jgi:hypothetical protein
MTVPVSMQKVLRAKWEKCLKNFNALTLCMCHVEVKDLEENWEEDWEEDWEEEDWEEEEEW